MKKKKHKKKKLASETKHSAAKLKAMKLASKKARSKAILYQIEHFPRDPFKATGTLMPSDHIVHKRKPEEEFLEELVL